MSSSISEISKSSRSSGRSADRKNTKKNRKEESIHQDYQEIVRVKELNPDIIRPSTATYKDIKRGYSKTIIIGKPGTGKSTMIKALLYSKKHMIPAAMVMSGTEDFNKFFQEFIPSTFVFNNYDEDQLNKFVQRQKIARQHLENPLCALIIDDCTDKPAIFRGSLQNAMYKYGRHWCMWYILSLQYGMDVLPVIRTNVDGVFILRNPNLRDRRVMYENYGGIIPDFKLFCELMDQITDDFTALYIHNDTTVNNWKDCVFWYKPGRVPEDFKFGCDEYWDFHYQRYNPEYTDPVGGI